MIFPRFPPVARSCSEFLLLVHYFVNCCSAIISTQLVNYVVRTVSSFTLSRVSVFLGIKPDTHSEGMFSWFPFFFPIKVREFFSIFEEGDNYKTFPAVTNSVVFVYLKGTTIHHGGFHSSLSLLEKVYFEKGLVRVVYVTTRANPSP